MRIWAQHMFASNPDPTYRPINRRICIVQNCITFQNKTAWSDSDPKYLNSAPDPYQQCRYTFDHDYMNNYNTVFILKLKSYNVEREDIRTCFVMKRHPNYIYWLTSTCVLSSFQLPVNKIK